MPRWFKILLLAVGAFVGLIIAIFCLIGFLYTPSKGRHDLAYDCLDTSGVHAISTHSYFLIDLHPPRIVTKLQIPIITDEEIKWDGMSIGHRFSGFIKRASGQWEERVDGQLFNSGTCKPLR